MFLTNLMPTLNTSSKYKARHIKVKGTSKNNLINSLIFMEIRMGCVIQIMKQNIVSEIIY